MPVGKWSGYRPGQAGFAWLLVLALLALVSAMGAAVAQRWSDRTAREKEQQLLQVGDAYAGALARYREESPGSVKHYPAALDQLLLDARFVGVRRHLRQLYPDPLTGRHDWVLVRNERGDIVGVHSRSERPPWAKAPQHLKFTDLPAAQRYADWVFAPRTSP